MTDYKARCAELIEDVCYLIDCVDHDCCDPVALMECREHLSQTRTALAQPEPEGVGDEELLAAWTKATWLPRTGRLAEYRAWLAHALALVWAVGRRPTTKPVPVSERLPGEGDCDERGRCWWLTLAIAEGGRGGYSTFWELTTFEAAGRCASHWRPHHALPMPTPTL
jgi:hypothetical protein